MHSNGKEVSSWCDKEVFDRCYILNSYLGGYLLEHSLGGNVSKQEEVLHEAHSRLNRLKVRLTRLENFGHPNEFRSPKKSGQR